jgi:glutathione S-transferase
MAEIILHHYPLSPYSEKIRLALGLKGATWKSVEIPVWTPRPKLTPMTGGYRRTPILQIGAEFYCDTLHILQAVEQLGSSGALYPKGQEGLVKAMGWWIEKGSFFNAVCLTIGNMPGLPQDLIDERRPLFRVNLDPEELRSKRTFNGSTRMLPGLPRFSPTAASSFLVRLLARLTCRPITRSGSPGKMAASRSTN